MSSRKTSWTGLGSDLATLDAALDNKHRHTIEHTEVPVFLSPTTETDDPATQIRQALQLRPLGFPPLPARHDRPGIETRAGLGLDATQIGGLLTGMSYPAQRWEVAWAQYNGAGPMMIEAVLDIPEHGYSGPHRIAEALRTAAEPTCCRHPGHSHHCPPHDSRRRDPIADTTS